MTGLLRTIYRENHLTATDIDIKDLLGSEGVGDFALLDIRGLDGKELEYRSSLYHKWIERAYHGGMGYLERHEPLKYFPDRILEGAKGLILMVFPYHRGDEHRGDVPSHEGNSAAQTGSLSDSQTRGRVARYARGRDYHKVVGNKLKNLVRTLSQLYPAEKFRAFVDAGPLDERYFACKAGLGSLGKNGLLITPLQGSWVFIGEIITTIDVFSQQKQGAFVEKIDISDSMPHCPAACTLCRNACPTGALREDGHFDARRCISYLTIEHRGPIPEELRPLIGDRFFGCDECQEACPFNSHTLPSKEGDFYRDISGKSVDIDEILQIRTHSELVQHFAGSPLMRLGPEGLLRNALTVAGNSGDTYLRPRVESLVNHLDPAVKEHALWALQRLS